MSVFHGVPGVPPAKMERLVSYFPKAQEIIFCNLRLPNTTFC